MCERVDRVFVKFLHFFAVPGPEFLSSLRDQEVVHVDYEFDEFVALYALKAAVVLCDASKSKFLVFAHHVLLVYQRSVIAAVEVEVQDVYGVRHSGSRSVIASW